MTNETQLWNKLKKALKNTHIKMTRIESGTVRGIPDIAYNNGIINGWIELKVKKLNLKEEFCLMRLGLTYPQR